ncbi:DedA family protein [Candidatus Microgenomates bacterium]|nr:DedA family protein [Candidatus Microgenomates bacterium]
MDFLIGVVQFVLHIDDHLVDLTTTYGTFTHAILFLIVFAETGFVVTPFLPGDSLLFAAGAIASLGSLNIISLWILLVAAAILGDSVNYWIGNLVGPKVFRQEKGLLFSKNHLKRTQEFYEKYGTKTIILARFVPIIRTFAPFVAGIGKMRYPVFLTYNIAGGTAWVSIFVFGGYFFGNLPGIKENFSVLILAIIVLSVVPLVVELLRNRKD